MRYLLYLFILLALVGLGFGFFRYFPKPKKASSVQDKNSPKSKSLVGDTKQLSTIFSSIEDGLVLTDNKGVIALLNSAAANMTGWDVEDAIGIGINTVVKITDSQGNLYEGGSYPFNKVVASGASYSDNNSELITRDNQKIAVNLRISPLRDQANQVSGAVALIRNITDEKMQEGRLADFISTASHEMRTPVAAIEGYLALVLNNKVATIDDKARDYLEKAEVATRHLGQLFQDLLTSAKAEDGRLVSHPQVIEVGEFLRKLTDDLKFVAEKHNLATQFGVVSADGVKSALSEGGEKSIAPLYYAYVDPGRLREVITNLYDNAVKYTSHGKITIGISGDDQVVQFYVRDTGSGIPAEDIPHLFQKFYRVDNSATRTIGGNGLGLFICRKIVELYSGRIWVQSEVGKGSTFYINLPRLSAKKATDLMNTISPTNVEIPTKSNSLVMT